MEGSLPKETLVLTLKIIHCLRHLKQVTYPLTDGLCCPTLSDLFLQRVVCLFMIIELSGRHRCIDGRTCLRKPPRMRVKSKGRI